MGKDIVLWWAGMSAARRRGESGCGPSRWLALQKLTFPRAAEDTRKSTSHFLSYPHPLLSHLPSSLSPSFPSLRLPLASPPFIPRSPSHPSPSPASLCPSSLCGPPTTPSPPPVFCVNLRNGSDDSSAAVGVKNTTPLQTLA